MLYLPLEKIVSSDNNAGDSTVKPGRDKDGRRGQESKHQPVDKSRKIPLWLETLRLGLMPTVIALISLYVTSMVSQLQIENANMIAQQQRISAERIASAELETQHLSHMVKIYSSIIDQEASLENSLFANDALIQRIQALRIYGNEALPFLVELREHYGLKNEHDKSLLFDTTKDVINQILQESQLDFSKLEFKGNAGDRLNLRKKQYADYNLSRSKFTYVNLYKANFQNALLRSATFDYVDLQDASFKGANMDDAHFTNANLRGTDFSGAYLHGTKFDPNCQNIEEATFSIRWLLNVGDDPDFKDNPINSIKDEKYTTLLLAHEEELEAIHAQNPLHLDGVYQKLGIEGSSKDKFSKLKGSFEKLRLKLADLEGANLILAVR